MLRKLIVFISLMMISIAGHAAASKEITKSEAQAMVRAQIDRNADANAKPIVREAFICATDHLVEQIFSGGKKIDKKIFEERFATAMDQMGEGFKNEDPASSLLLLKCIVNSNSATQMISGASTTPQPSSYTVRDLDTLRVYIDELMGEKVKVQGIGNYVMSIFMLKGSATDVNPLIIDTTQLSRDQQREILQWCNDILSGCQVTVYGTVGKVNYRNGIIAERIDVLP